MAKTKGIFESSELSGWTMHGKTGSAFPRTTLEPHLTTLLTFNGLPDITFIRVGDEEKPGESHERSITTAEHAIDRYATTRWSRAAA